MNHIQSKLFADALSAAEKRLARSSLHSRPLTPRLDRRLKNVAAPKSYFRRHTSDALLILTALSQTYYVYNMQRPE